MTPTSLGDAIDVDDSDGEGFALNGVRPLVYRYDPAERIDPEARPPDAGGYSAPEAGGSSPDASSGQADAGYETLRLNCALIAVNRPWHSEVYEYVLPTDSSPSVTLASTPSIKTDSQVKDWGVLMSPDSFSRPSFFYWRKKRLESPRAVDSGLKWVFAPSSDLAKILQKRES